MDKWNRWYPKFFTVLVLLVILAAAVVFLPDAYRDGSLYRGVIRLAKLFAVLFPLFIVLRVILSNWRAELESWQAKSRLNRIFANVAPIAIGYLVISYFFRPGTWGEAVFGFMFTTVIAVIEVLHEKQPSDRPPVGTHAATNSYHLASSPGKLDRPITR